MHPSSPRVAPYGPGSALPWSRALPGGPFEALGARSAPRVPPPGAATTLAFDLRVRLAGFVLEAAGELPTGGVTAIFGPSGSGKSTLLRILAGLEARATGRVALGRDVWLDSARRVHVAAHRRPVGYMFQEARLFPHLSGEGNLRYAAKRARSGPQVVTFDEVVDALDLAPLLPRRTWSLSGGERQRLALGRTLLAQPRLLLLDEPLSALDTSRKMEILPYLEALHPRFSIPMLYVSHSVDEVALLADRILVLDRGRVAAQGRTGEILERLDPGPLGHRSAAATVVGAHVVRHDPEYQLTWLDLSGQTLVVPQRERFEEGEEACLVIRARDVSLATRRPEGVSIQNVLAGRIGEVREEEGSAFAEVLVDLGPHRLLARILRLSLHDLGLAEGSPVFALLKSVSLSKQRAFQGSHAPPERKPEEPERVPGAPDRERAERG